MRSTLLLLLVMTLLLVSPPYFVSAQPTETRTIDDFVAHYTNVLINYGGTQCVALANQYNSDVVGCGWIAADLASDWYIYYEKDDLEKQYYTRLDSSNQPQKGDLAVWNKIPNASVHIALVLDPMSGNDIKCFTQNPGAATVAVLPRTGLLGYLRPKKFIGSSPEKPQASSSGSTTEAVMSDTLKKAEEFVSGAIGKSFDLDNQFGLTPVDVVDSYAVVLFGQWDTSIGWANSRTIYSLSNPKYFTKIAQNINSAEIPKRYDILCCERFGAYSNGLVGVVVACDNKNVTIITQAENTPTKEITLSWAEIYKVCQGWLRPISQPSSQVTSSSQILKHVTSSNVRIKNRWTGKYLHEENKTGNVQCGDIKGSWKSAQWVMETNDGFVRFRNLWTNDYMHIETNNGTVQLGIAKEQWWSAMWILEKVNGFIRIKSKYMPKQYVNTERKTGSAECNQIPVGAWSSQWLLEPVK